jgi:hypothetical protein
VLVQSMGYDACHRMAIGGDSRWGRRRRSGTYWASSRLAWLHVALSCASSTGSTSRLVCTRKVYSDRVCTKRPPGSRRRKAEPRPVPYASSLRLYGNPCGRSRVRCPITTAWPSGTTPPPPNHVIISTFCFPLLSYTLLHLRPAQYIRHLDQFLHILLQSSRAKRAVTRTWGLRNA